MQEKFKITADAEKNAAQNATNAKNETDLETARQAHAAASDQHAEAARAEVTAAKTAAEANDEHKASQVAEKGHLDEIDRIKSQIYETEKDEDQTRYNQLVIEKAAAQSQYAAAQKQTEIAKNNKGLAEEAAVAAKKSTDEHRQRLTTANTDLKRAAETVAAGPKINMQTVNDTALNSVVAAADKGIGSDVFSLPGRIHQKMSGIPNRELADDISKGLKKQQQKERVRDILGDDVKDVIKEANDAAKKAEGGPK